MALIFPSISKWLKQDIALWILSGLLATGVAVLLLKVASMETSLRVVETESAIARMDAEMSKLREGLLRYATVQAESTPAANLPEAMQALNQKLSEVSSRISNLEAAIESSPEKALSIPMLRKDLDQEHKRSVSEFVSVREEIARTYDLLKWFLGLIATIVVTMFIAHLRGTRISSAGD